MNGMKTVYPPPLAHTRRRQVVTDGRRIAERE
jgi:hypothetical protein